MKDIKNLFIYGAGGLGNQLFQLAAGFSIQCDRKIVFETGFTGPRKTVFTKKLVNSLNLNDSITFKSSDRFQLVTQFLFSYLLRVSAKTHGYESLEIHRGISSLIGSIYFSFYYRCFVIVTLSKGVGYHNLPNHRTNQLIIGYFQSFRYLEDEDRLNFMSVFRLKYPGPEMTDWSNRAIQEKPIVVHIRLGDYLQERDFGVVNTEYISESLSRLSLETDGSPIWAFSDQMDLAKSVFPSEYLSRVVWVPEIDSNPFSTLSIMRLGSGYVIANSTFSWWAAWLKENELAPVYCPSPWFSKSETPTDLIPKDWTPIDSNFEKAK